MAAFLHAAPLLSAAAPFAAVSTRSTCRAAALHCAALLPPVHGAPWLNRLMAGLAGALVSTDVSTNPPLARANSASEGVNPHSQGVNSHSQGVDPVVEALEILLTRWGPVEILRNSSHSTPSVPPTYPLQTPCRPPQRRYQYQFQEQRCRTDPYGATAPSVNFPPGSELPVQFARMGVIFPPRYLRAPRRHPARRHRHGRSGRGVVRAAAHVGIRRESTSASHDSTSASHDSTQASHKSTSASHESTSASHKSTSASGDFPGDGGSGYTTGIQYGGRERANGVAPSGAGSRRGRGAGGSEGQRGGVGGGGGATRGGSGEGGGGGCRGAKHPTEVTTGLL
eukprot:1183395-Prorocentrum_minimum.AAC.5